MTRSICILDEPPSARHAAMYCSIITDISTANHILVGRLYISTNLVLGLVIIWKQHLISITISYIKMISWSFNHYNGKHIFREMVFILKCLMISLSQFAFALHWVLGNSQISVMCSLITWCSILMCNNSTSAGTSLEGTPMFAHITLHRTFNPLGNKCPWWQDGEAAS